MAMTNKKTLFFEENNLFNINGIDLVVYYNPHTNMFELHDDPDSVDEGLVETPYFDEYESAIWREYRKMLSEDELALSNSYDERYGYFDFMKSNGLFGYYEQAELIVKEAVISDWEARNKLSIDWDTAEVK